MLGLDQLLAQVTVAQFQPRHLLLLRSELWPTQGTWGGSPLVSLKGAVGSSHVFRLLLVPCPHFPEDAGDTTGSTSCQWQGGLCSLGKGGILFSHLLKMPGSKEETRVGGEGSQCSEPDLCSLPSTELLLFLCSHLL